MTDRSSKKPIEFASVVILSLPDSAEIKGTATDRRGRFLLEDIPSGRYILSYSFVGYEGFTSQPIEISTTQEYKMPAVELLNLASNLGEVVVTARRSLMNTGIDRKIYNVEQDLMSSSGSASDVLKNVPSVEVDIEGEVSLRGSTSVMILINGKPSPLLGNSTAEVLQQLPANSIERIEVITNPSAKFKPDGTSGIINIVLKKNSRQGFNGSLSGNIGNRERYNATVNLNYKPKAVNYFLNYSFRHDNRRRFNDAQRYYIDPLTEQLLSSNSRITTMRMSPVFHMISGGFDHTASEQTTWGINGNIRKRDVLFSGRSDYLFYDDNNDLIEHLVRSQRSPELENSHSITGYFNHAFKGKEDHQLNAELSISRDDEEDDGRFTIDNIIPLEDSEFENIFTGEEETEKELTIDYTNPLSERSNIEAGYDGYFARIDLEQRNEYFDKSLNRFVLNEDLSNRFIFDEKVHALYATYQYSFEKWGFNFGLRGEQVNNESNLVTLDSITSNSYFNLYPTLHLSFVTGENSEVQLNYSRRVNRPDGDELNPFPNYEDPRNISAGNPKLRPEFINSVELGYKWQNKTYSFVPTIYYRYRVNGFTSVTRPLNDTVLLTTEENLDKDHSAGLELIFSAKPGKIFTFNLSSNLFYNRINAETLGFITEKDIISFNTSANANFNFPKGTAFQLSGNFRSARLTPQGKNYPSYSINAAVRQNLFNNKMSATLAVSDIFNSLQQRSRIDTPEFKEFSTRRRDGTIIYFGVSYRFGVIRKEKEEKVEFDENIE